MWIPPSQIRKYLISFNDPPLEGHFFCPFLIFWGIYLDMWIKNVYKEIDFYWCYKWFSSPRLVLFVKISLSGSFGCCFYTVIDFGKNNGKSSPPLSQQGLGQYVAFLAGCLLCAFFSFVCRCGGIFWLGAFRLRCSAFWLRCAVRRWFLVLLAAWFAVGAFSR